MFVTPRVVETEADLKTIIDDLRRRMYKLDDSFEVFQKISTPVAPATQ